MIDSTHIKAHRSAASGKGGCFIFLQWAYNHKATLHDIPDKRLLFLFRETVLL
jgi:hypothetical protein